MKYDSEAVGFSFFSKDYQTYKLTVSRHSELLPMEMTVQLSHQ